MPILNDLQPGSNATDCNTTKAYTFDTFSQSKINLVNDAVDGNSLIIVGSKEDNFMSAFINNDNLVFEPVENNYPIVLKDNEGNE